MKILVTGGCGFIGHNLIKKLSQQGENEIYSLDNNFTGNRHVKKDNVYYVKGDTNKDMNVHGMPIGPDIVYHLGEYSRIATSFEDIKKVWKYNIIGTLNVLLYCVKHNSKLIYAGSSSKFGNNGKDENLSPYSWVKSKNVELIKNFDAWFGLKYAIAYFYNVYGDEQISNGKYATVIGIFLEQYKKNKPLTVVRPGTQKRFFTHIEDTIDGLIKIGQCGSGDNYCLCDNLSLYSIEEVAKIFSHNIQYVSEQQGNRTEPSIPSYKCVEELGWRPNHSLEEYIGKIKKEFKR